MKKYKYVIIGSGAAGINAADSINKNDKGTQILVITEENAEHYYRPKLIDYIAGKTDFDSFKFFDQKWYKDRNITVEYGQRVTKIDTENKTVSTNKDNNYEYEKLLLASGGYAFVPPPFRDKDPLTVRSKKDADEIIRLAKENKSWCIVGGGLLGLEIANAMKNRGCNVTVIEAAEYPLPRQLDKEGGEFLKEKIKSLGIDLILNSKIEEITENKILLSENTQISFDQLMFCTGIRPDIEFAKQAGIKIDKAIEINDYFETNVENIYAAGDSCIYNGKMFGLWMPALQQGKIAGTNMAGNKTRYQGTDPVYKLKVVGVDVVSVGNINSPVQIKLKNKNNEIYKKAFLENDKLVGFILYGDTQDENALKQNLNKDFSYSEKYFKEKENHMSSNNNYVCEICGYVYDTSRGDPDNGVNAGTAFKDIPDSWVCPVCGATKEQFSEE